MKIYIENTPINIYLNNIENYKTHNKTYNYIFSDEGIFKYTDDDIYHMNIIDDNITKFKHNNISFISDSSRIIIKNKSYQIPIKHKVENISADFYELRPKSLVKLVIEYEKDKIKHIYFLTNADFKNIKEDIDTFLSLLKIY